MSLPKKEIDKYLSLNLYGYPFNFYEDFMFEIWSLMSVYFWKPNKKSDAKLKCFLFVCLFFFSEKCGNFSVSKESPASFPQISN